MINAIGSGGCGGRPPDGRVGQRREVTVPEESVVLKVDLGIERDHFTIASDHKRVDLDH